MLGFSESLALELEMLGHRHVHVTAVCPSYVTTGLFEGARPPRTTRLLTAERVAELTLRAVLRNRPTVRTPWLVAVTPAMKAAAVPGVLSRGGGARREHQHAQVARARTDPSRIQRARDASRATTATPVRAADGSRPSSGHRAFPVLIHVRINATSLAGSRPPGGMLPPRMRGIARPMNSRTPT